MMIAAVPSANAGDVAAHDGGTVGGSLAAEDHARWLDGRDHFHLDGGGGNRILGETFARSHPQLYCRAGIELDGY